MVTETAPDNRALRTARRERALAQMRAHGLDMLVLGRQANVRYVTGVPQLWVAGTRPFAPVCVLDGATGEIHLNSTWDEGVPEEIGRERLYGMTWSPMKLIEVLKDIDGARTVRRWDPTRSPRPSPSCCRSPFPTPNSSTPSPPFEPRAGSRRPRN